MPLQGGPQHGFAVKSRVVVTFFVHLARQLGDGQLGQGRRQRMVFGHALEKSSGGFGVFADPVLDDGGLSQRGLRQDV